MDCKICGNIAEKFDTGMVLNKYHITYYRCPMCGFIFTEKPYWLEEAYTSAIANLDIGLVSRNYQNSRYVSLFLKLCFTNIGKCLDYGGGGVWYVCAPYA